MIAVTPEQEDTSIEYYFYRISSPELRNSVLNATEFDAGEIVVEYVV